MICDKGVCMSVLIAAVCGAVGGFVREILGNKGFFAFPRFTEKNLVWAA